MKTEELKVRNQAIFGTCYRKDSTSKYYAQLYADLESKPNKTLEENIYVANINSHCNNILCIHFEVDHINKKRYKEKK